MRKIILVGQAPGPGKRGHSKEPLDLGSGKRLSALAGMDHDDFLSRFERINLADAHPGKDGKGDEFDVRAAMARADHLRRLWRGRKAVLLGRNVAIAFKLLPDDYDWFQPVEIPPGIEAAVMPHPSGISHWWNDPANVQRARDFMLRLKLGMFEIKRAKPRGRGAGQREKFSPEQVAAALEAGRGIHTWAAEELASATGIRVVSQTIKNYIDRYPSLQSIVDEQRAKIVHKAQHNIVAAIESGDVDSSWRLMRSRIGQGTGFELQTIRAQHSGEIEHFHRHAHLHAKLSGLGLDLTRYSSEQLEAIEDFAGMLGESREAE